MKSLKKTHGKCNTRLYFVWRSMRERCNKPSNKKYHRYGARGVKVCDDWLNNFELFEKWAMANGYNPNAKLGECTIDRIDNNGDYCPENCRWVNIATQNRNTSKNILVDINGKTQTLSQWSAESGVPKTTLFYRYRRGWSGEDLIRRSNY